MKWEEELEKAAAAPVGRWRPFLAPTLIGAGALGSVATQAETGPVADLKASIVDNVQNVLSPRGILSLYASYKLDEAMRAHLPRDLGLSGLFGRADPQSSTFPSAPPFKGAAVGSTAAPELESQVLSHSYSSARDRDIERWKTWKANPTAQNLAAVLKSLDPAIQSEIRRWSGQIPDHALQLQAKSLAIEAVKTYDPNAGAALATHTLNRLKKLSRIVYQNQDLVRLPEARKLETNHLYKAEKSLEDSLGRAATSRELQEHLGWSRKKLEQVSRLQIGEYIETQDAGGDMFDKGDADDAKIDMVYHDMDPVTQLVFEHTTGYGGKRPLTAAATAAKLNLKPHQVSYIRSQLVRKFEKLK